MFMAQPLPRLERRNFGSEDFHVGFEPTTPKGGARANEPKYFAVESCKAVGARIFEMLDSHGYLPVVDL